MCESYHPQSCKTPALIEGGLTRRGFLHHGMALVSTAATVPAFLSHAGEALSQDTTMRLSSKPGVPDDRVLVVVQLSGGNDGLNTVVPYGDPAYFKARPSLAVREKQVIPFEGADGIGLHPALAPLQEMIDAKLMGIVQGVGYPNPNRSHFASMDIWHTADLSGKAGRGWVGQAMDTLKDPRGMSCVAFGNEAPLAALGRTSRAVSFEKPELFRWLGRDLDGQISQTYDAVHHQPIRASAQSALAFVNRTAMDAQAASDRVRKAVAHDSAISWPRNGLANQLQMVAKMIRSELPTRVYYVALGGFDTHAAQARNHQRLMEQFGSSMKAFYDELEAAGHRSRVVSLAFSEFGRRVGQNASGGTDHGCAGPSFVFGEQVTPGLIGTHPSLTQLDQGDLIYRTDFRSLYTDLLEGWMKIDAAAVLGGRFPSAGILKVACGKWDDPRESSSSQSP